MIELKKEIVFKKVKKEFCLIKLENVEVIEYLVIKNLFSLVSFIIDNEELGDYVESNIDLIEKYNYIVEYYKYENKDLSNVVIEIGDYIYNELIELIKE